MAEAFGRCSWPGMTDYVSCTYTVSHGITPGAATLVVPLSQDGKLATYGDLGIYDGTGTKIELWNAKVSDFQATRVGDGYGFMVTVLDRRWKWAFPTIDGNYNQRDRKGKIKDGTDKTLHDLIRLCLEAMDEVAWEIELPDVLPDYLDEINWSDTVAAQALAELVERHGGVIVWRPWDSTNPRLNNNVLIATAGVGGSLPTRNYRDYMPAQDLPEGPASIIARTAPACYQVALPLEAVGFEPGGEVVPIDDLSYKPADGWAAGGPPPYFRNITIPGQIQIGFLDVPGLFQAPLTRTEYTKLAKECVYRTYRVKCENVDGTPLDVPGYGPVLKLNQLVLLNGIVTKDNGPDGKPLVEPAKVYGIFHRGEAGYTMPTEPILYEGGFSIDPETWTVKFSQYLYRINPTVALVPPQLLSIANVVGVDPWQVQPAELVLLCSVHVRDNNTFQVYRDGLQSFINPDARTKPLVSQHNDIVPVYTAEYDRSNKFALRAQDDNLVEVNAALQHYLDRLEERYKTSSAEEREYPGIVDIVPDGAISQVTWSVGGGNPCKTRASRNSEHAFWLPTYQQRRGTEKLKLFLDVPRPTGAPFNELFGG